MALSSSSKFSVAEGTGGYMQEEHVVYYVVCMSECIFRAKLNLHWRKTHYVQEKELEI